MAHVGHDVTISTVINVMNPLIYMAEDWVFRLGTWYEYVESITNLYSEQECEIEENTKGGSGSFQVSRPVSRRG